MRNTILLIFLTISFTASTQIPTAGLVAYYAFNGNSNDLSGNLNNGIVNGATLTADRFGNVDAAYSFNGIDQWIDVANSVSLNPSSQLSISVWVESSATQSNAGIIGKWNNFNGETGNGQEQYLLQASNQGLYFHTSTSSQQSAVEPNAIYNNGNWHHYVAVWDGSLMKLYRDNVLVETISQTGSIPLINQNLEIGRYAGGQGTGTNQNYFDGKIDDIRIYDVAVDSAGISALYGEGMCFTYITVTDTLIINMNLTGLNPVSYQNTISIYPNPTNDHITIDNGNFENLSGYQIEITNSMGQQVFQSAITQEQFYIDLATWTGNGIYFVHIIDGQGNTIDIRKIVLQ